MHWARLDRLGRDVEVVAQALQVDAPDQVSHNSNGYII